jgi:hypothetical protein
VGGVVPAKRYWILRYERAGRERIMSVSKAADVSLTDARKLHVRERAIVLAGNDPLVERRQTREQRQQQERRLTEAVESYIAAHAPGWRGPRLAHDWRQSLRNHVLPKIGKLPVGKIGTAEVLACLTPLWPAG